MVLGIGLWLTESTQASTYVPNHSSVHPYLIPVSKLPEGNVNFTRKCFKLIPNSSSIRETGASSSTVNINSLSQEGALNFCLKGWELKKVVLINTCLHWGKQHMEGDNRWLPKLLTLHKNSSSLRKEHVGSV